MRGPIERIDLDNELLVALGQTVFVDEGTSFGDDIDPAGLDGLAEGEFIEVSGLFDAEGNVVASFIGRAAADEEYKVKGRVENLDEPNSRFSLRALTVDYSMAVLEDFPTSGISEDDFVEVECDRALCLDNDGVFLASEVEFEDERPDAEEGDEIEIEGFITRFESADDFDVGAYTVTTTPATEFENGTSDDLALNVRIEVEGRLDDNGILVADEIKIKLAESIRINAPVDAVDADAGTLTLLGIDLEVNEFTRFKDKGEDKLKIFTLADISPGDFLRLRASQNPAGEGPVIVTRIDRRKMGSDDEIELQGFVEEFDSDAESLVILGVTIESAAQTNMSGSFFMRVTVGSLVRARGVRTADDMLLAEKLTLKDDDFDDQDGKVEIEGFITRFESALDFDVAGRPVTTDERTRYEDGTADDLALEVRIEVEGYKDDNGVLVAAEIEFDGDEGDDEVEVEGYITRFVSAADFDVENQTVTTNDMTVYVGGSADDLPEGVEVEVHGSLDGDDVLIADEVEFEGRDTIRIAALLQAVDSGAGLLTILGVDIQVDPDARFDDGIVDLSDLEVDDYVKIRARSLSDFACIRR